MKISSNPNHPDYHDVVCFVDRVTLNGEILPYCVNLDTEEGTAECVTQPFTAVDGVVQTHTVRGQIGLIWRVPFKSTNNLLGSGGRALYERLLINWHDREAANGL